MQRNIERDRSTRAFLKLLRPKIAKVVQQYCTSRVARAEAHSSEYIAELEAVVVDIILRRFFLGEGVHPLRFLFGKPNGHALRWIQRRVGRARRYYDKYQLSSAIEQTQEAHEESAEPAAPTTELETLLSAQPVSEDSDIGIHLVEDASSVVRDGATLTVAEYRVLRFCLRHAHRHRAIRLVDNLHLHLAKQMKIDRREVTRIFGRAERRVVDALGLTDNVLQQKGVDTSLLSAERQKKIRRTRGAPRHLSPDEVADLIEFVRAHPESHFVDLAWAFGVSKATLDALYQRYKESKTRQEIVDDVIHRRRARYGGQT
jgi:hypothetical protein